MTDLPIIDEVVANATGPWIHLANGDRLRADQIARITVRQKDAGPWIVELFTDTPTEGPHLYAGWTATGEGLARLALVHLVRYICDLDDA